MVDRHRLRLRERVDLLLRHLLDEVSMVVEWDFRRHCYLVEVVVGIQLYDRFLFRYHVVEVVEIRLENDC